MGFLDKGSLLKHKHLGYVVRINDIQEGVYTIGWLEKPEMRITDFLLKGPWSAMDLVREFMPHKFNVSRWDRLLDDNLIEGPYLHE
jgi:hypothetical protein